MAGGIKMKKSRELNMSIPEITDKIDVREISENFEIIDKILSANLFKRNTSTTEINVTAYPPYYIMKNTENNPINYFDPIFEETFTLGPLEEKKFFINAPQSVYITSDVQIEYDYFIPVQEAINDISPGGTSDYDNLDNKPQINGNVLSGDKTASELGLADINDIPDISASAINGNIKINGIETNVYTHPTGTNPHGTTKSDVGLGNVPNVATNDQTPSYTEATTLAKLASGEKLSVAFGKISKAITDLISHIGDSVKHITSTERTNWNAAKTKADTNETNISNANTQIVDIYNRAGGGKNLINPSKLTYKNCTYTENTDEHSYTITNTGTWSQFYNYVNCKKEKEYILSFTVSNITGDTSINDVYIINNSNNANLGWIGIRADGTYSKKFKAITDGIVRIGLCPNNSDTNRELTFTISEIMVRPVEIKEPTYVPYIPTNAELQSSFSILNVDNSKRCWYSRIISDTAFDSSFSFKLSQNAIPDGKRIPVRIIFTTQYTMTPIEILFSVNSTNASPFTIAMLHGGIEPGSVLKVAIYSKTVADEKTTYYTVKILNRTQLYGMAYIEYPCVNDKLMFTVSYSSTQITETTEGARKINIYTPTYSLMS